MENTNLKDGVYKLPNGNWGYRFTIRVNGKKYDQKRLRDTNGKPFTTQLAATRARKAAIEHAKQDISAKAIEQQRINSALAAINLQSKTIRDVYQEYCLKGQADRAFATIRKQDSIWRIHLDKDFGDRFIDDVTTADIQDYLSELYYTDGYAYRYVESFLKMFYLIFGQAYSREYLSVDSYNRLCRNKDTKIHMPRVKVDDDLDIIAFTDEECRIMDEYFKGTNAETAYLLGRYCGLRINECYGLCWQDVDLENGVLHIKQQMAYQNGLIKLVPLKTRNARRDVYLNSIVIKHLTDEANMIAQLSELQLQQREQNQKFILDKEGKKVSSLELVNSLPEGKIQTVNSMKYHSRLLKEKFGIEFKYHHLRHTYGTQLAVMNTPTHILCNQMGHGNINVTQRYYIAISKSGIEILQGNLNKL